MTIKFVEFVRPPHRQENGILPQLSDRLIAGLQGANEWPRVARIGSPVARNRLPLCTRKRTWPPGLT